MAMLMVMIIMNKNPKSKCNRKFDEQQRGDKRKKYAATKVVYGATRNNTKCGMRCEKNVDDATYCW